MEVELIATRRKQHLERTRLQMGLREEDSFLRRIFYYVDEREVSISADMV